jgi:hypothetical protein
MFWLFFFTLIAGDIVAITLFPVVISIATMPLHAYSNARKEKSFLGLGLLFYFKLSLWYCRFCLWAAFCAMLTHKYTSNEQVVYAWIYWVFALFAAGAPLGFFLVSTQSTIAGKPKKIEYFTILSFVIFAIWPELARRIFGWIVFPIIGQN